MSGTGASCAAPVVAVATARREGAWIVAVGLGLATVAIAIALTGREGASVLRHAYVVPVIVAAARWGHRGGAASAGAAVVLHAPFVLPMVERTGFTAVAAEGLATFVILLLVGTLTGALVTWARREHAGYRTLLAIEHVLAEEAPLATTIERLRTILEDELVGSEIAVIVRDGDVMVTSGAAALIEASVTAAVLASGRSRRVADTGGHARPRRLVVVPIVARDEPIGALAVVRLGELGSAEVDAITTLGAYIGLGLENARLLARQRRFAAELSEAVTGATRRLQEIDRAKSMFVATASHELRTPLTALLGFSELLVLRRFPPEEVTRLAGLMRHETERLVRIIDDLLDLSRLEQGLAPLLRRAAVDVAPALLAAVEPFRRQRVSHHFEVECPDGLPRVDADPDALDRVVKNLISNAVKYSPPGLIRVAARDAGAMVRFEVEDRGRGIPAEALPRLFEPYFRVSDTAAIVRGAGIGLAVVKSLVESHGGTITVESAASRGTRVWFTLPVSRGNDG